MKQTKTLPKNIEEKLDAQLADFNIPVSSINNERELHILVHCGFDGR